MTNISLDDKEFIGQLFDKVNYYGCHLDEVIIERLLFEHRTIKQSFMGIVKKVIEAYAEDADERGCDRRNEASVKWAKQVVALDHDKMGFPFI